MKSLSASLLAALPFLPQIGQLPVHAPDAGHTPPEDAVTADPTCETIRVELLVLCEKFFRAASSTVHTELRQFLTAQGRHPVTSYGWFLDALALTTYTPHDPQ